MSYLSRVEGNTLNILLPYSTFQFFSQNVLFQMQAHTTSCIVRSALLVHAQACQSDLHSSSTHTSKAWGQSHWLQQAGFLATGPGQPILLSCAGPLSLSRQGVTCTATGHLSSSRLFLHWAGVCSHICASKACFASGLSFKETRIHWHVEARPCDVVAGAGGQLVLCQTYVANLEVTIEEIMYTVT
jgi:hypothetical protein